MTWEATFNHVDKNKLPWAERSQEYIDNKIRCYEDFKNWEKDLLALEKQKEVLNNETKIK